LENQRFELLASALDEPLLLAAREGGRHRCRRTGVVK
jgi:hypothetical protein